MLKKEIANGLHVVRERKTVKERETLNIQSPISGLNFPFYISPFASVPASKSLLEKPLLVSSTHHI